MICRAARSLLSGPTMYRTRSVRRTLVTRPTLTTFVADEADSVRRLIVQQSHHHHQGTLETSYAQAYTSAIVNEPCFRGLSSEKSNLIVQPFVNRLL
jgi:hypothetical protein